jgi:hypothetical protein
MKTDQRATRASILLGDIDLACYQLPDSSYRYSLTDAFMVVAEDGYDRSQAAKRYIEKTTSKQSKSLFPNGFGTSQKTKVVGENQTAQTISQQDVVQLWMLSGNWVKTSQFTGTFKAQTQLSSMR